MTPPKSNDRFLKALRREPVDKTPVWFMRQAGRYLPEYRRVRASAGSFLNLCMNPELACQVTMQPLDRFKFDAAILFSDILTIPHAMGLGLDFVEGQGPRFAKPVRSAAEISNLPKPDPEVELRYVMDAVRTIRGELDGRVPLIGFAGSPWTLACYMVEGRSGSDFRTIKTMVFSAPDLLDALLATLADVTIEYLSAQVAAGAQTVMIFDTWGGLLTTQDYEKFSLRHMKRIVDGVKAAADVPVIVFTKGGSAWLEAIADCGADGVGLDWTIDLGVARSRIGERVALQGNMDPSALRAQPERIRQEVQTILDSFGAGPGHIFNLGHGITPDIEPDCVAAAVEAVHEFSSTRD